MIILVSIIILLVYSIINNKSYLLFKSIENIYPRMKNLMAFQESINYYKIFPPVINIEEKVNLKNLEKYGKNMTLIYKKGLKILMVFQKLIIIIKPN